MEKSGGIAGDIDWKSGQARPGTGRLLSTKTGTVKLTAQDVGRLWSGIDRSGGEDACWLWTRSKSSTGYGRFNIGGRLYLPHRVVFEISRGPIPRNDSYHGFVVMHLCDTPACCNPKHLRLGTHSDNMRDMDRKGRRNAALGEACHNARFTEDIIRAIRADPRSTRQIARAHGINHSYVSAIKLRKRWAHVA